MLALMILVAVPIPPGFFAVMFFSLMAGTVPDWWVMHVAVLLPLHSPYGPGQEKLGPLSNGCTRQPLHSVAITTDLLRELLRPLF